VKCDPGEYVVEEVEESPGKACGEGEERDEEAEEANDEEINEPCFWSAHPLCVACCDESWFCYFHSSSSFDFELNGEN